MAHVAFSMLAREVNVSKPGDVDLKEEARKMKQGKTIVNMRREQLMTGQDPRKLEFLFSNNIDLASSNMTSDDDEGGSLKDHVQFMSPHRARSSSFNKSEPKEVVKTKIEQQLEKVNQLKRKLLWNDLLEAGLGTLGLFLAMAEYDIFFDSHYTETHLCRKLRIAVSCFTILSIGLAVRHSLLSYRLTKKRGKFLNNETFLTSNYSKFLIIECCALLVHNMPGVNLQITFENARRPVLYTLNTLFISMMLARVYLVLRLLTRFTKWRSEQAEIIAHIEGFEADTQFAVKALMKEKPHIVLWIVFVISSFCLGFAVRLFELPYYEVPVTEADILYPAILPDDECNCYQDYTYQWNGMWLIVVTMTTVGFGDYYPRTYVGKLIIIVTAFFGQFILSMMIVTLTRQKDMNIVEHRTFTILRRIRQRTKVKKVAAQIILYFMQSIKQRQVSVAEQQNPAYQQATIEKQELIERLLEIQKALRSALEPDEVPQEEKLRMLNEILETDIRDLRNRLHQSQERLGKIEEWLESQQVIKTRLLGLILMYKKLNIYMNRLDRASTSGPLKVLTVFKTPEIKQRLEDALADQKLKESASQRAIEVLELEDENQSTSRIFQPTLSKMQLEFQISQVENVLKNLEASTSTAEVKMQTVELNPHKKEARKTLFDEPKLINSFLLEDKTNIKFFAKKKVSAAQEYIRLIKEAEQLHAARQRMATKTHLSQLEESKSKFDKINKVGQTQATLSDQEFVVKSRPILGIDAAFEKLVQTKYTPEYVQKQIEEVKRKAQARSLEPPASIDHAPGQMTGIEKVKNVIEYQLAKSRKNEREFQDRFEAFTAYKVDGPPKANRVSIFAYQTSDEMEARLHSRSELSCFKKTLRNTLRSGSASATKH